MCAVSSSALTAVCSVPAPATISAVAAAVTRAPVVGARLLWKHCRQSTGRPCVGLNGTVVSMPHAEHSVRVSVRESPAAAGPAPVLRAAPDRLDLQGLQRFGSFLNCLSKKKSCSPAVKMNSPPQSAHVKIRSINSIPLLPCYGKGRTPKGLIVAAPLSGLPFVEDLYFTSRIEGGPELQLLNGCSYPVNVGRCTGPLCRGQRMAGVPSKLAGSRGRLLKL